MSEHSSTTTSSPSGGGRFPFLIGILLVANLAVISNVRMGSVYLNQLKSVLLPQNDNNNMPMEEVRALVEEVVENAIQKQKENAAIPLQQTNDKNNPSDTDKQKNEETKSTESPAEEQPKADEEKKEEPPKVEKETPAEELKPEETTAAEESKKEEVKKEETPPATADTIQIDNSKPIKLDKNTIAKGSSYTHKHEPLNILLLYADDWRHDSIGAAGTQIVRTPFIDQLARDGIRFTHNCVTTSVCWISRSTLYTGQFMSRHKSTYPQEIPWYDNWNNTFPAKLREAGYYLGQVGKWHLDNWPFVADQFDVAKNYYGDHWYDGVHTTKMSENYGIEFLKNRPRDKPFMLSVCYFAPHSVDHDPEQYLPQPESMSLYENETIIQPISNTEEGWKALPSDFTDNNEARRRWRMRFEKEDQYQKMMKNYFRLISEVDDSSGKIVQELEHQGILNNTLIIFTTDNGYFHAEHGMAGKWYPHQESIRVPLVIRDPRMPKEKIGTLNDEFTLNIDLATTILGAAGLPQAPTMQGRDIADLYLAQEEWRDEFFYEHPTHIHPDVIPESSALVRKDYKYMRWPGSGTEQLFDLKSDPLELHDLIKSEQHQVIIAEMRTRHDELKRHALWIDIGSDLLIEYTV